MIYILRPGDNKTLDNMIGEIKGSKKTLSVTITDKKKPRTTQQNAYFWALMGLIEAETGTNKEDVKTRIMDAIGFTYEIWCNGKQIIKERSTTTLNTEEFGVLITASQELCANLGIKYPLPAVYGYDW